MILSKYPLENCSFTPFLFRGNCVKVWQADWFAQKGFATVDIVQNDEYNNCKLIASYKSDKYEDIRLCQMIQISKYILQLRRNNEFVILAGDLNTQETEPGYKLLTEVLSLNDCWLMTQNQVVITPN